MSNGQPSETKKVDPLLNASFLRARSRVFNQSSMIGDSDFQLCLDIDDYVAKARKERKDKEAEFMAALRFEAGPEKRKIRDVHSDNEGSDAERSNLGSTMKKLKTSASGEWKRQSHPILTTPTYVSSRLSAPTLMGRSTSPRTPFTPPPAPRLRPITITDTIEDIESNFSLIRNENPYESHDVPRLPLRDLPYGHLIDHIPVPETTSTQELINDMHRRRREGRAGINFDIHVDRRDRQALLEEVQRQYEGRNHERFSSPSEDKENSDESLGIFEDVDLRDNGRQPGRAFQEMVVDDEEEGYDMAEIDEDQEMLDDSDVIVTSDDSTPFSEYVLTSSDSSFNDSTPYTAPTTRAVWRHSATAANRGRVFY
ncbi:hypothetical protein PHISCL_07850 [Aspergillus sclerotialis]|uniref:Uncharacterized protein n=1 Tax=Aspergillus sclerotialis TaxID=2070753 RepID=A0A3A2Z9M5_9EURO|nr:hypothetical protein PHISCL_07850 [Aspergillus sclerotialis]